MKEGFLQVLKEFALKISFLHQLEVFDLNTTKCFNNFHIKILSTALDDVFRFREVLEGRDIHRGGEGN